MVVLAVVCVLLVAVGGHAEVAHSPSGDHDHAAAHTIYREAVASPARYAHASHSGSVVSHGAKAIHAGPAVSHAGPVVSHTGPVVSHAGPVVHHAAPAVSYAGPAVSHAGPAVSHAGPVVSHTGPVVHHAAPAVSYSGPAVSHAGPVVSHAGPAVSHAGPVVSHAGPAVSHAGPVVHHAAPALSYSGPAVNHAGPAVSHAPVSHAGPVVHHAGPAVSHAGPAVSHAPVVSHGSGYHEPVRSQYHAQDAHGQYSFGYNAGASARDETRDAYGNVHGSFSYIDSYGNLQTQHYVAGKGGFQVEGTNLPVEVSHDGRYKRSYANFPASTGPLVSGIPSGHTTTVTRHEPGPVVVGYGHQDSYGGPYGHGGAVVHQPHVAPDAGVAHAQAYGVSRLLGNANLHGHFDRFGYNGFSYGFETGPSSLTTYGTHFNQHIPAHHY